MKKTWFVFVLTLILAASLALGSAAAEGKMTVLFTSDIHSWFNVGTEMRDGVLREHGGAARLMTLLAENQSDDCILVDAGDFAMGTLLQAGYTTDAYELRLMGRLGYEATTFGNHEFDPGATGAASMLRAAIASGDRLPVLLTPANLVLSGTLTPQAQDLADALKEAGSARYILREVNGVRVAVFGLMGTDAIMCVTADGVSWEDPVKAAQKMVDEIGNQADVIICVSHSGTKGDGTGEDATLISKVKGIDVVISGHSHLTYEEPVIVRRGTVLGSCGCYLSFLGRIDLNVLDDGTVEVENYRLIPIDENVAADADMEAVVNGFWDEIAAGPLASTGYAAEQVIAHTDFTLKDAPTLEEVPLASMIADSYLHACREAGIDEVDVAIVGMGTVRAPLLAGDITVENAFEVCSLGFGKDGSPGHPLLAGWLRGSDLRLLMEVDAFVGPFYSSVLMNFAGLETVVDVGRVPLDRVKQINIVRADGTREPLVDDKLYCVAANLYAVNMLGNICDMSFGLLDLSPMDASGVRIQPEQYYDRALIDRNGNAIKEWQALCGYLESFEAKDGVAQVPDLYRGNTGRKMIVHSNIFGAMTNPGMSTLIVMALILIIILVPVTLILTHKKRKARRAQKKAAKAARKAAGK